MYFPQLVINCITGGVTSANCSQPRLSKSSSTRRSSGAQATEESTPSWRRRQSRRSSKGNEIDVDSGKPSSRRRSHRRGLPTTAGELEAVFQKFDGNGEGKLSLSELGTLMRSLGCPATDEELQLMVSMADSDGDGFINLSNFAAMNTFSVDEAPSLDDMESAFGVFDFDGNGGISPDELLRVFKSLGHSSSLEDCRNMIAEVDSNRDGYVSFDEFLTMMITSSSSV